MVAVRDHVATTRHQLGGRLVLALAALVGFAVLHVAECAVAAAGHGGHTVEQAVADHAVEHASHPGEPDGHAGEQDHCGHGEEHDSTADDVHIAPPRSSDVGSPGPHPAPGPSLWTLSAVALFGPFRCRPRLVEHAPAQAGRRLLILVGVNRE